MQAIEKQVVNLAGATTIAPRRIMLRNMKKAAAPKQIAPHIKLFSLLMKLKTDSHPYGSGSFLPTTKSLAEFNPPLSAFVADESADCLGVSVEFVILLTVPLRSSVNVIVCPSKSFSRLEFIY